MNLLNIKDIIKVDNMESLVKSLEHLIHKVHEGLRDVR